jgi:hypothetical protein
MTKEGRLLRQIPKRIHAKRGEGEEKRALDSVSSVCQTRTIAVATSDPPTHPTHPTHPFAHASKLISRNTQVPKPAQTNTPVANEVGKGGQRGREICPEPLTLTEACCSCFPLACLLACLLAHARDFFLFFARGLARRFSGRDLVRFSCARARALHERVVIGRPIQAVGGYL